MPIAAEPRADLGGEQTLAAGFAASMDRLGPFEPAPLLAVGVSGGADSTALTLLAADWARARGGNACGLIVDHGLRPGSAVEAETTWQRLADQGIASRILTLTTLRHGPGLAARARAARLECLSRAATGQGALHLLLGHHAGDQAETVLMRQAAGSGSAGLAGIAALRETRDLRLLRPLLATPQGRLRNYLRERGLAWVEDPSNTDLRATRARLRAGLADAGGDGPGTADLLAAAAGAAAARCHQDHAAARELAAVATISPLGYALIGPGRLGAAALSALWRMLSGRAYPPPGAAMVRLATELRPATLAGLRLLPAGRLGPGWLLVREQPPVPVTARHGAVWDRFRLDAPGLPFGLRLGSLGDATSALPDRHGLPACILRSMPALFAGDRLHDVPLLWPRPGAEAPCLRLLPDVPAAGAPWLGCI